MKKEMTLSVNGKHLASTKPFNLKLDSHCPLCGFVCKAEIMKTKLRWHCPICKFEFYVPYTPSDFEKLGLAVEEFKKAVMESYLGKFIFWILDRMSQFINWFKKILSHNS